MGTLANTISSSTSSSSSSLVAGGVVALLLASGSPLTARFVIGVERALDEARSGENSSGTRARPAGPTRDLVGVLGSSSVVEHMRLMERKELEGCMVVARVGGGRGGCQARAG